MNTPIKVLLAVFALSMIEMEISVAGNFTWTGSSSTDWNTSGNWSPSGVPGSGDTVTIVTGSNNVYLAGNTPVTKFTMTSGTVDLQTYTLTISSASTFTSGQVNNGNLVMYGTSTLIFSGTRFGASVYATGNSVLLNGSTFNDTLSVVKKGASADNSKGGNTFNGAVSIIDSANANLILSDSFPDVFNSRLWLANQGTAKVYVAHRGTGNEFNDDVTFIGKNIWSNYYGTATYDGDITFDTPDGEVYFGYSTGSCSLGDGKNLYVGGSGFSAGYLYFRNFTQSDSTVSISLTLTGSARMWFESGSSFKAEINASAPFLYLDGTRFLGEAHITTTGTSSSTSVGGSYFAKATTIYHNPAGACTFTSGNTYVDTFAAPVLLKNGIGTMSINKSLFQDSVTFQNLNTVTGSDRFYISNSGNATMEGVVTLSNALAGMNFGNAGGTTTLDSSARLNVEGSYTGNLTLKNFVQLGANPVSITLNNTSTKLIVNSGTSFEGNFTYFGRNIQLNEATFNDTTTITRYGTGGDNCTGGNTFNGPATIMDSSGTGHSFIMAGTRGDDFNNTVTFIQKGTGVNLYPAYTGTSTFAAGVIFDGTSAIQVGYGGGKAKFDGIGTQSISRIGTNTPVFKKIELSKSSGSLELESPVTLTDSLILSRGILRSDSINLLCLNDNCIATAGSDSGYVEGFMKKTGNDAFTFPLGAEELAHPYHPMRISSPASSADAFLAAYLAEQQPLGDD
ncbi:MAG: hypothetical protein IT242_02305, partial [Bacteroidia bacterium]|nr:hypothetical protein [Bacteroidia bacterium]